MGLGPLCFGTSSCSGRALDSDVEGILGILSKLSRLGALRDGCCGLHCAGGCAVRRHPSNAVRRRRGLVGAVVAVLVVVVLRLL